MKFAIYETLRRHAPRLMRAYYNLRYGHIRKAMVARLMKTEEDVVFPYPKRIQPDTWPYRLGLFHQLRVAEQVPTGYRVFMKMWTHHAAIAAPIGLHWLFRFARSLWELSYWEMFPQVVADAIDNRYFYGVTEGYAKGYAHGKDYAGKVSYNEGYKAGWEAMQAKVLEAANELRSRA